MSNYPFNVQPLYIASRGESNTILIDPIVAEAAQFNGQHAYGSVLSELFMCDVIVQTVNRTYLNGPVFIHFSTPADRNYACNVPVTFCGVSEGRVRLLMTVEDLRKEVDFWDEAQAKGF
jgi:hypothetical protein